MKKAGKYLEVGVHLLFWLALLWILTETIAVEISSEVFLINGQEVVIEEERGFLPVLLWGLLFKATSVYAVLLWVLPHYFNRGRIKEFTLFFLLVTLGPFLLELATVFFVLLPLFDEGDYGKQEVKLYSGVSVVVYLLLLSLATGYWFIKQWYKAEQLRQNLEKEKLVTELHFLKSQINPHFLFNTLNNLFSMAQANKDESTASGIAKLSGLMRYMLYDSNSERVELKKEVDYIQQFVELQQLRVGEGDSIWISFHLDGMISNQKIAPMLLIPFVENAFKHGINPMKESIIQFRLKVDQNKLSFHCKNTIHRSIKSIHDRESGIGLENVKKRLELLYPGEYQLAIKEDKGYFVTDLKLVLGN